MRQLEALEAIAVLGFFPHNVEDGVHQLCTLGVVALGPVVSGTGLAEDEVVRTKEPAVYAGADSVHGSGLQVEEDGSGDVFAAIATGCHWK